VKYNRMYNPVGLHFVFFSRETSSYFQTLPVKSH